MATKCSDGLKKLINWQSRFGFAQCGNAGKNILAEYPRKKLEIDKKLICQSEKIATSLLVQKGTRWNHLYTQVIFSL